MALMVFQLVVWILADFIKAQMKYEIIQTVNCLHQKVDGFLGGLGER